MYFIDPKRAYTYFSSKFKLKKTTVGWWAFKCPFCGQLSESMKMAVHFHYGVAKCWVCGYKENIVDFVADYEGCKITEAKRILREAEPSSVNIDLLDDIKVANISDVTLPYGYSPILEGDNILGERARKYLSGRGFSLKELDRLGIGYVYHDRQDLTPDEDFFGYIIIPFKQRGKLVYYIGRDFIGNFLRYKNPQAGMFGIGKGDLLFNQDALEIFDECYFTEGWADALTLGRQGVSTQGWSFSSIQKEIILRSSCQRLIFVPDAGADNAGESFYEKAIKLGMEFLDYKEVQVLDLNRLSGGKDANELGKEAVIGLRKTTPMLNVEEATRILLSYKL